MGSYQNCIKGGGAETRRMTSSGSFKGKRRSEVDFGMVTHLHGYDPVRIELTRFESQVREKERELVEANVEIKAVKYSERLKEKAIEELSDELRKLDNKSKATEALLETKNLEIKKINEEKKAALAAQFAAEATLRRVHAAQKDDEMPPIQAIIAPLVAELKLSRLEIAKLQDDNKALDRLTKSKEDALLEAERPVQIALEKSSLVDDLQNKNFQLTKQIGMCKEENKILDKMHRQKVVEVEKLAQSVSELEEAVLAGGAAANAARDYQRKVEEINEEKRVLDRELARAKISAERVAVVVANDWKDANDKVMPVKQWLEERKIYQGEIKRLKDKLATSERAAKAEAKLKDKYQLRFKVLEERLKSYPSGTVHAPSQGRSLSNSRTRRLSLGGLESLSRSTMMDKIQSDINGKVETQNNGVIALFENADASTLMKNFKTKNEDYVSGTLYDMLQKEVITIRKACHEKDQSLKDKDDAIEMLAKKVETLNKAMEVEAKKMRRELAIMEKQFSSMRNGNLQDRKNRHF